MARNTPREMQAQARAQKKAMQNALIQKRAAQQQQAVQAQAQGQAAKKKAAMLAKKQKKKALEMSLKSDLQKMIFHMKTAQQHWLTAMNIFAGAKGKIASYGVDPMNTSFYKGLSYIDDVYEGMGMFIKKAKKVAQL